MDIKLDHAGYGTLAQQMYIEFFNVQSIDGALIDRFSTQEFAPHKNGPTPPRKHRPRRAWDAFRRTLGGRILFKGHRK